MTSSSCCQRESKPTYLCCHAFHTQSKVFGAGYPSLPTMMVEEFFEQKYREQMEAHKR